MTTQLSNATEAKLETRKINEDTRLLQGFLISKANLNTRHAYQRDLLNLQSWLIGYSLTLTQATRPILDLYREQLANRDNYSPASQARKLAAVSAFYGYLVKSEKLGANPASDIERPKVGSDTPRTGLTRAEAQSIIAKAKEESASHSALVALLLYRGLRVSEAVALNTQDLSSESGSLVALVRRKGGKRQRISFPPEAAKLLKPAIKLGEGALIRGERGGRITRQSAARMVAQLAKKIELNRALCPHDLRHAAITNLLDAGGSLAEAQDFAGHASPVTTRRYDRTRRADTAALKLASWLSTN